MAISGTSGTPTPVNGLSSSPATSVISITKGSPMTKGTCHSVACGTAGTLNFTDADGNTVTAYPLQAGYNPIAVQAVQSGGSASDLWALY